MSDKQPQAASPVSVVHLFFYAVNTSLLLSMVVMLLRVCPDTAVTIEEGGATVPALLQLLSDVGTFTMEHRWWLLGVLAVAVLSAFRRMGPRQRPPSLKGLVTTFVVLSVALLVMIFATVQAIRTIGDI